jgi:hypothetical protein
LPIQNRTRFRCSRIDDYTISYRSKLPPTGGWPDEWDVFISAYNNSDRVRNVFGFARAKEKHWLIHPEYNYAVGEYPTSGTVFAPPPGDEAEFLHYYFGQAGSTLAGARVCVDSTGFMRPHLMLILPFMVAAGVRRFDVLYSEPGQYMKEERTSFSSAPKEVRSVRGFEGNHTTDTSKDLLIIGSGYDHPLISSVAEHKKSARKVQLLGLPSLRPDMYQENVLMAHYADEALGFGGVGGQRDFFAPANDPFVVASVLQNIVTTETSKGQLTNLYLCPTATKPQALGFALFYVTECRGGAASMIFPFANSYSKETTTGLSRVWKYTLELP